MVKQKVTMKDIADQLGLSVNAVSLALNNKTGVGKKNKNLIIDTAEQMGYIVGTGRFGEAIAGKNLCILIKTQYFKDSDFYAKILLGVEEEAKKNGYDVLINFTNESEDIPDCVEQNRVCGMISVGRISDEYLAKLKRYGISIVVVDHSSMFEPIDCVISDNKLGSYKVTRLLVERGYQRIGFLGDLDYSMSIKERFFGYQEGISLLGMKGYSITSDYVQKYCILSDIEQYVISHNLPKLIEKLKGLKQLPQAFVCSNDEAAIQFIHALNKLDYRVPDDIAIVGFDNISLSAAVTPKLTTVNVHKEFMGQVAVQRLIWRMGHRSEPIESIMLSVEVVERNSMKQDI